MEEVFDWNRSSEGLEAPGARGECLALLQDDTRGIPKGWMKLSLRVRASGRGFAIVGLSKCSWVLADTESPLLRTK